MTDHSPLGAAHVAAPIDDFDPFAGPRIERSFPSTDAQREIWLAARLGDDASLAFNEAIELSLTGVLDLTALQAAVDGLVARHEALRSTFSDDGLTVLVGAAGPVAIDRRDWSDYADQTERLAALRSQIVSDPFDLTAGPLFRVLLVRVGAEGHHLFLSAHHLVCDGWSFGVLVGDLSSMYSAHATAGASAPGAAPRFGDFATLQRSDDEAATAAADVSWWVEQLHPVPPPLELPTDRARPVRRSFRAEREDLTIDAADVARVEQLAAHEGASLFVVLLSMFGTLLHRVTGTRDALVGIPWAGQPAAGMPELVGHAVSTLPLRVQSSSESTTQTIVRAVRGAVLDASEHQAATFGSLLKQLAIPRDPSRPPLISVVFNVDRRLDDAALAFAGLRATFASVPRRFEAFELFVNVVVDGRQLVVECQYNADLFDRATIRGWLQAYRLLLRGAAASPEQPADRLPIVDASALGSLTNGEELALPEGRLCAAHALIEAQARRTPDAVAIEFEGAALTYAQLDARANQLAHRLRAANVTRGTFVGLCVNRSPDLVVGVLGILKAGGAYVPLDPGHPRERLAFMLEDVGMQVLVTERAVAEELSLDAPEIVLLDDAATLEGVRTAPLATGAGDGFGESPAYVIYTSGSTGRPNGVVVPHRALVNLLRSTQRVPGVSARDRVLAITTLSFDIAASEVLLPLTVGARIVLATRETASDGLALRTLIEAAGVTLIDATPATYRLLFAAGWSGHADLRVICTGEALPPDLAEQLSPCVAELWNGYGPTETTVWSTFWRAPRPVGRVLIGRPIANTRTYVLDANRQPVPIGAKGELFIGGLGVASGYLRRPELTAARFLDDPFVAEPGARMYKTGDVVRFLADGTLDYLGRADNQVKIRGYRIELGEIESALGHHPAVRQVAVVARNDGHGGLRLVAYVTPHEERALGDDDMREFLKRSLPDYMVPAQYVRLDAMPLTPSGKIDRKSLAEASADTIISGGAFVAPRTPTETLLAELWSEALGMGRVGVTDDFFSLGGHSLLASQVLARLRRNHGRVLSFRQFFEAPTIEQMARVLDATPAPERANVVTRIPRRMDAGPAPLTIQQERTWLLEDLDPALRAAHNIPAAWRLLGPLDLTALRAALQLFAVRHEAMRTSFVMRDGVRYQQAVEVVAVPLEVVDVSDCPAGERESLLSRRMLDDQDIPFDLSSPPLFRAVLFRISADEHVLYTVRHALIWDGWSFDLFVAELSEAYRALRAGESAKLPTLPIAYSDFAAWQREWIEGDEAQRQLGWWREHLGPQPPVLELPTDHPRPVTSDYLGDRTQRWFSRDEVEALRDVARRCETTLFTVLFAAWNATLYRFTGQSELIVGTPARARAWMETENIVGPFVNMLAIRTTLGATVPFRELIAQVRETTLSALSRSEVPLERVGGKLPSLRAFFSMQDARSRPVAAGDLRLQQVLEPQRHALNDLILWTMESGDGLKAVLNFRCDLFEPATAERFLESFRTMSMAMLRDPDAAIGEVPLDAATTEAQLRAADEGDCIVARLRDLVSHDADAIAMTSSSSESLSYGALLQRSEDVAQALVRMGVTPGACVGVHLEPGPARVIALLGALLAGGDVLTVDLTENDGYRDAVLTAVRETVAIVASNEAHPSDEFLPANGVLQLTSTGELVNAESRGSVTLPSPGRLIVHAPDDSGAVAIERWTSANAGAVARRNAAALAIGGDDVVATLCPMAHEGVIMEALITLVSGARLQFLSEDEQVDPVAMRDALARHGATLGIAPSDTWSALVEEGWVPSAGFRGVVLDSVTVPNAIHDVGLHAYVPLVDPDRGLWSAMLKAERSGESMRGQPTGNGIVLALDESGAPVPTGVWGEVHLADRSTLANGVGREVTTGGLTLAARSARVRGRCLKDGSIELQPATASEYSIIGARVSMRAVAAALMGHAAVADAHVGLLADAVGRTHLVAWVATREREAWTESELRRLVRRRLPERAVPSLVIEMESVPRSAGGSVDVTRLPSPFSNVTDAGRSQPRTDSERVVAAVWRELLEVDDVRVGDNFFAMGGHSLLCFRAIDRLEKVTGVRVGAQTFLLGTVEQVAATVDALKGAHTSEELQLAGGGDATTEEPRPSARV